MLNHSTPLVNSGITTWPDTEVKGFARAAIDRCFARAPLVDAA